MNYRKKLLIILILLSILSLNICTEYCLAVEEKNHIRIFVEKIYSNYGEHNFKYVYSKLHPAIQGILPEEKYVEFQQQNFKKYNFKITDYVVGKKVINVNIPQEFQEFISKKNEENIKKITVSYHMEFINNGNKVERDHNKDVFIYLDKNKNLYLLWDPQIIE